MDLESHLVTLERLQEALEAQGRSLQRQFADEVQQDENTSYDSHFISGRIAANHNSALIEAITKLRRCWAPCDGVEEQLGWDQHELLCKLFHALSNGIAGLQSQSAFYYSRANNIGHLVDGRAQIMIADRHTEKLSSTDHAAIRIRQYSDAAKAVSALCAELLELKAEIFEYLSE